MPVSAIFAREVSATLVRLGISQREAAARSRLGPRTISNMCLGQIPSAAVVLRFSAALGISAEALLEAAGYAAPRLPTSTSAPGIAPCIEWPANMPSLEHYPIPPAFRAVTDFCLRVNGESMSPALQAGDIVGITARGDAQSGQLVAARLNGRITLALWQIVGGVGRLQPDNPAYPALPINRATMDFAIMGIVAWSLREF